MKLTILTSARHAPKGEAVYTLVEYVDGTFGIRKDGVSNGHVYTVAQYEKCLTTFLALSHNEERQGQAPR